MTASIGFFPASRDINHASTRIRCIEPLRWLWDNTSLNVNTCYDNQRPDIGVCFKRPTGNPQLRVLDLSDNHLSAGGESARAASLAAQTARLCVVPTAQFAGALAGIAKEIRIIPDCIDPISDGIIRDPQNFVLWFGCWGSKHHPGTGMRELLKIRNWLAGKSLLVISNSIEIWREIAMQLRPEVNMAYREWSVAAFRSALSRAAAVVVPVTASEYTTCKSHNRVTSAINAGVPVLASHLPSYEEFGCTTDWAPGAEPILVDKAKLEPYHIDVIGRKWKDLLEELMP